MLEPEQQPSPSSHKRSLDQANFDLHTRSEEVLEAVLTAKRSLQELHQVYGKLESIQFEDEHYEQLRAATLKAIGETLTKVDDGLELTENGVLGILTTASCLIERDLEKTTQEDPQ